MWRDWTTHKHKETKFLSEVLPLTPCPYPYLKIEGRGGRKVDKTLARLFSVLPSDYLSDMLGFLYAVVDGKVHLAEIEELRRNKMFWGEIDEVEETMKEKVASLEVFILAHALGKLETERGYSHQIVKKEYRVVLQKLAEDFRLTTEDTEDVFHLIILHETIIEKFFQEPSRSTYEYLVRHCQKYGRDADDFLDLLLAAVFLVAVIGTRSDAKVIFNFLLAERTHSPARGAARLQRQAEKKKKTEQARLRAAGLDGNDLMKLLDMKPGPEFGKMLAAVQAFARGEVEVPKIEPVIQKELLNRAQKFRQL